MESNFSLALAVFFVLIYIPPLWKAIVNHRKLSKIPTIGASGFFSSFIGALQFARNGRKMVQEGYDKYPSSFFRIPMMTRWMVVITGGRMVEEFRMAHEDVLSMPHAINESHHLDVTVGPEAVFDKLVPKVVRLTLTKNIGTKFPEVQSEIVAAFNDYVVTKGDEWTKVPAYDTVVDIVCRASNMLLVGAPLCRDPDYLALMKNFTMDTAKAGLVLNMFPRFMRRVVVRFLPSVADDIERAMKHLTPLIEEHRKQEAHYGKEWEDKPNDIFSWFNDISEGQNPSIRQQAIRVLMINNAAIHTTSIGLTNVLFELAARPEYVQPMRDEVKEVIEREGWTKAAIDKLRKVDSFVREAFRFNNTTLFGMRRKVMKDFTFSDGTTIPAGALVALPQPCIHFDKENYTSPEDFDGFRFEKKRGEDDPKYRTESVDPSYLTFGQGRHACPGRYFASNEIKTMLAHVLLNYDIRVENPPVKDKHGMFSMPDPTANILFRKRQ